MPFDLRKASQISPHFTLILVRGSGIDFAFKQVRIEDMARKKIESAALRRRLGPTLLVLYGTGVTVGAGIYVLVGPVAGYAGIHAPWAFFIAAVVMGLTVASYAE